MPNASRSNAYGEQPQNRAYVLSYRIIAFAALIPLTGCAGTMAPSPHVTSTTPSTIPQVQKIWHGEKVRVAVMEFDNKTGAYYQSTYTSRGYAVGNPIGSGMKEQLVTALMQTNAFIVLERQAIKDVVGEQDFGASGRVRRETAPDIGEIEGAEFLIYGAVTEYTPAQTHAGGGVGIGSTGGALLGIPGGALIGSLAEQAVTASMSQDHVAIDLRLVDARTGRVVNATSVEASANDLAGAFGGIFGTTLVGLSAGYQTPMQKAIRACMIKAVNWIADNALDSSERGSEIVAVPSTPRRRSDGERPPSNLVRQIQNDLNVLGYNCGKPDGRIGSKTETAIERFERDNSVSIDGSLMSTSTLQTISQELHRRVPKNPLPAPRKEDVKSKQDEWGFE